MSSYVIRNLDADLLKAVRARAEQDNISLQLIIKILLAAYRDGNLRIKNEDTNPLGK